MSPLEVLWLYRYAFLGGLLVTLQLLLCSALVGTVAALLMEWICQRVGQTARRIANGAAFAIAGIPALVILFWFHYPAQTLLGVNLPPFITAVAALLLINTFAIYRIIADAITGFPGQYISAARVCGLTQAQTFRHIQAPLLLRVILPRWIDQQIVVLHTSLFASLISVEETFRVAQRINSAVYQPVTIYTAMALLFLGVSAASTTIANRLRRRVDRDLSER